MAYQVPNFTSAPNVGPEPPGLLDAVKKNIFGSADPNPLANDPYNLDDQQLLKILTDTKSYCEPGRELFEYGWWRNLLYLLGRQWIYWNPTSRQWNDKRLAKWVPKPITNIIRTAVLSVRATAQSIQNGVSCGPVGQNPKNIVAAQIADDMEPLIADRHGMGDVMLEADFWAIVLGTAFLHVFWDTDDPSNTAPVDTWKCQLCQTISTSDQVVQARQRCPSCQSMALMQNGSQEQPIGEGKTIAVSPLEALMPLYAQRWEQVDRIVYLTWRPQHDIENEYGTDITKGMNWDTGPQQRALQLYKAIATTSDLMLTPSAWNTGAFTGQTPGTTEQHLWIKPCRQFPEGLYQRFLGDGTPVPIHLSDRATIPYVDRKGKPVWPWVHYPYEDFGGRLYAQGTVDCIVQKQDQLNQNDSMTQMVVQRMGNPVWLEPKGAEVERLTGEPGVVVRYQSVGNTNAKPERVPGENPPQSLFTLREQYKQDAEELAGTYDVLKGQKPSGVEAYSALQLLVDRSQSRFTTFFKARGRCYRDWYKIALELERQHGPTQRVREVMGPNNAWTFQVFNGADLDGDIVIHIEDGSTTPKTALARRAALEHAKQLQLINPADTEQQYKMLQELGLASLTPSLDADVNSALQEQDAFETWAAQGFQGVNPLVRMPWHNDHVHLQENRKWMNSDAIRAILDQLKATPQYQQVLQLLAMHLEQHMQIVAAQLAPAPGAAPGSPAAPPGPANTPGGGAPSPHAPAPGVGAGRAMANSAQESTRQHSGPGDSRAHPPSSP